jgi:hypothetical protein
VYRVLPSTFLYNVMRLMSGALVIVSSFIGMYNTFRTIFGMPVLRPATAQEVAS